MAFGIGMHSRRADAGSVRGIQREIACECWFTSTGKATPLMLKIQDEEGEIQTIGISSCILRKKRRMPGFHPSNMTARLCSMDGG